MFTPNILRLDSIDSTNLEGSRRAKAGAPEGLCIVAREQTRGRGRLERTWHSPRDAGVYLSILLRPQFDISRWPLISLVAALAVAEALRKTCDLKVDIKWPNDICFGDQKLCGILAETVETKTGLAAILGIGINLTADSVPPELKAQATSVEDAAGTKIDRETLTHNLLDAIRERYAMLQTDVGAEHTIREWCANSSYAFDRRVRVFIGEDTVIGVTRGLETDGGLRVELADGTTRVVRAGDVTALRAPIDLERKDE